MGLKRNFIYNYILLFSNYLFPIIVFPYISRVLGVTNIGICNFVDSLVNYAILFAMLGIGLIGTREISNAKGSKYRLDRVFSSLVTLNFISAAIILVLYWVAMLTIPSLSEYKDLLFIGTFKIISYVFLIEWLYQGTENFKYVTIRTIAVKFFYVAALFLFVHSQEDLVLYYILSTLSIGINAIINWQYKNNFVRFEFRLARIRKYLKPMITMGIFLMLVSMYSTFNTTFLGFASNNTQVGYYATAIKIYTIILGLYTAFNGVMMPRCCSLISQGRHEEVITLFGKSFEFLYAISIPIMCYGIIFAPEIIRILAGPGYEGAIIPMRVLMPLLLINGIAQILVLQVLISNKKDKAIFINSFLGAIIGISMNIVFVGVLDLQSIGSVFVLLVSETVVALSANYFVSKFIGHIFKYRFLLKQLLLSIPYFLGCAALALSSFNSIMKLISSGIFCATYFCLLHFIFNKNGIIRIQALQLYDSLRATLGHRQF